VKYKCVFLGYLWRITELINKEMELVAVGIEPQREASREAIEFCERNSIAWFDARNIRKNHVLKNILNEKVDLVIVGAFGQILDTPILSAPRYGVINVHPSYLPEYKGKCPITEQLKNKEKTGGVTLHWMTEEIDSGEIILQQKIPINIDDDYQTVLSRCVGEAIKLFKELLRRPIPLRGYASNDKTLNPRLKDGLNHSALETGTG